jgi:hypothetical protein
LAALVASGYLSMSWSRGCSSCPLFPGAAEQIHVSLRDPVLAMGSEKERLVVYRAVRDGIRARLLPEIARRS